jgi:hypothetical protein
MSTYVKGYCRSWANLVKVTGHVYSRGGSNAISLKQIEEVKE